MHSHFAKYGIPESHGIIHAKIVLSNLENALKASKIQILEERQLAMRLAALLHDADDRKYF